MDPDQCLKEIIGNAKEFEERWHKQEGPMSDEAKIYMLCMAADMATSILSLDSWIRNGGFLPKKWQKKS